MALSLELGGIDDDNVRRALERIALASVDVGELSLRLRCGTGTVTFTAAANSAASAVNHGMGSIPIAVMATTFGSGIGTNIFFDTQGYTATQFSAVGHALGAITGTFNFTWIAIG